MKYQEGLSETKQHLKRLPEYEMRELCDKAGLTSKEKEVIVSKFRKKRPRLHASEELGMCESRYSIILTDALHILKRTLENLGFIDKTF